MRACGVVRVCAHGHRALHAPSPPPPPGRFQSAPDPGPFSFASLARQIREERIPRASSFPEVFILPSLRKDLEFLVRGVFLSAVRRDPSAFSGSCVSGGGRTVRP